MAKVTPLQAAMGTLVGVFQQYAGKDGDALTLSKAELKELLQKELSIDDAHDPGAADKMLKCLDADGDGKVNFEEFATFVAAMTMFLNECFKGAGKKK